MFVKHAVIIFLKREINPKLLQQNPFDEGEIWK